MTHGIAREQGQEKLQQIPNFGLTDSTHLGRHNWYLLYGAGDGG